MDFEKIIRDSLASVNEDFGDNPRFQFIGNDTHTECVSSHKILMSYSEKLLENYHSELRKLLIEQGIRI